MTAVSGKPKRCLDPECTSTTLTDVEEAYVADDRVYVGTVRCEFGHFCLYSRKDDAMAKTRRSKKPSTRSVHARAKKPAPRTPALPGLEDHGIKPLDDAAARYAALRDQRMDLTKDESELKQITLALMKKHDKTIYKHNGVEIRVIPGEADVKVKVAKPKPDDDDDGVEFGGETLRPGVQAEH